MNYRHTVVKDDITDVMLHPQGVHNELKKLWQEFLSLKQVDWILQESCLACGGKDLYVYFNIWGRNYTRCKGCSSVFLNPRPSEKYFEVGFFDSPISRFIISETFMESSLTRFEKVIHPLLSELLWRAGDTGLEVLEVFGRNRHIVDFLSDHPKISKYMRLKSYSFDKVSKAISIESTDQIRDNSCNLILLLMSIDQILAPDILLKELSKKLTVDGSMLILGRLGSGIDIQVLRGNNPYVFPLEHINLFSVEGYESMIEKSGMVVTELSTPGLLDTEYLKDYYQTHPEDDSVFKYFLNHRSSNEIKRFQYFIQEVRLSSALKLICKRSKQTR